MRSALDVMAKALSDERCDALTLDWSQARYQHTVAVRTALAERGAPATTNRHLAALRGVLRECWRLGQLDAADYQRAVDLPSVRGSHSARLHATESIDSFATGSERTSAVRKSADGTFD